MNHELKKGGIMEGTKEFCSWCNQELHNNGETQWCDCGWWDALPTREEENERRNN